MPELPEVETIARNLRDGFDAPPLPGMRVERISLRWERHIDRPAPSTFRKRMRARVFQEISRRGKFLVLHLDQGTLLIHLRMSGDLQLVPGSEPRKPHDHTIFLLDSGWHLRFNDARKFGRVYLVQDVNEVIGDLGPEPLEPAFTPQALEDLLRPRKRILKPLLMDQTFIAGLGNIYTDEALFHAGLHPLRRSDSLNSQEISRLWQGIRTALERGIQHNGASIDWVYRGGDHQNHFHVYQRAGDPCTVCSSTIERSIVGQRGTHFCPECQPEVRA